MKYFKYLTVDKHFMEESPLDTSSNIDYPLLSTLWTVKNVIYTSPTIIGARVIPKYVWSNMILMNFEN